MAVSDPTPAYMSWFPYKPRRHQDQAVSHAATVFEEKEVGLLSADCGVGKTIAVLSGYLATRSVDPSSRLLVLTRTHSQSRVFEEELSGLRLRAKDLSALSATSMVSRVHVCPMKDSMDTLSSNGFLRACATLVSTGRCAHYWNFYRRDDANGAPKVRQNALETVDDLTDSDVVTREVAEDRSADQGLCPYELMRWCARRSRVVIGPYGYLFRERVRHAFLASLQVSLSDVDLVVDEAHNLPEHVLDSEASVLSGEDLMWLRDHTSEILKDIGVDWLGEAIQFLYETMMVSLDRLGPGGEIQLETWEAVPRWIEEDVLQTLLDRTRLSLEGFDSIPTETPLDRLVDFLYTGSRSVESDDWHVTLEVKRGLREEPSFSAAKLKVRPLNAAGLIAPVLMAARSAILMSGTLRPTSHYAQLMGVKNARLEDLASPYPQGSRLVLIDKTISTRYRDRGPSLWKNVAERLSAALSVMPANKSTLIAFPSYQIMRDVLSYGVDCGFRERLDETPGGRIEVIQEAVEQGPHAVFCVYGGKFSEGVDLVTGGSSLLDMIIGVGIPFSPPTSYQRALQHWYERRFGEGAGYYYSTAVPSIRRVAQLVGRLRRSPSDRGVVVLLDRRFLRYIEMFGPDIAADLWPYEEVGEMQGAIRMFTEVEVCMSGQP